MSLSLTLYNFAKRHNSTALPSSGGSVVDVVLKRETSLNAPTFLLQGDLPNYNYASFNGAYYFIDDIVSVRDNVYELRCTIDVLATLKSDILATNAFVEYAAQGNGQIVDSRLGVEYGVAGFKKSYTSGVFPGALGSIGSRYVTVLGQTGTATYFVMPSALNSIFASISNWTQGVIDPSSIETILDTGLRQLVGSGSAAQCVRDAYILACGVPTDVLGGAEEIYLGMFNTGVQGQKIATVGESQKTTTIAIPHQYADWRKQSPYEICRLFLPLYGTIEIPSDMAADSDGLTIKSRLNVYSGEFTYYISGSGRGAEEIVVGGNCSAPIAVGASNLNVAGSIGSIMQAGLNAFAGNASGAAASTLSILSPTPSGSGSMGGISNTEPNACCMIYYRNTSGSPGNMAAVEGIPLLATRTLSNLSGYVKTRGASVGGAHRDTLREMANNLLDNGVFLE